LIEEINKYSNYEIIIEVSNYDYGYKYNWNIKKFKNRFYLMNELLENE